MFIDAAAHTHGREVVAVDSTSTRSCCNRVACMLSCSVIDCVRVALFQRGAGEAVRLPGDLGVRISAEARHHLPRPQTGKHPH